VIINTDLCLLLLEMSYGHATGGAFWCTNPCNSLALPLAHVSPLANANAAVQMSGGMLPSMMMQHSPHILSHPSAIPELYNGQIIGVNGNLLTGSGSPIMGRFNKMHRHACGMGWYARHGMKRMMDQQPTMGDVATADKIQAI
jgi:hypothetical protein